MASSPGPSAAVRGQEAGTGAPPGPGEGALCWLVGLTLPLAGLWLWVSRVCFLICKMRMEDTQLPMWNQTAYGRPRSYWGTMGRRPLIFRHKLSFSFEFSFLPFSAEFALGPKRLFTSPMRARVCAFSSLFFQNTLPIPALGSSANLTHPQKTGNSCQQRWWRKAGLKHLLFG